MGGMRGCEFQLAGASDKQISPLEQQNLLRGLPDPSRQSPQSSQITRGNRHEGVEGSDDDGASALPSARYYPGYFDSVALLNSPCLRH